MRRDIPRRDIPRRDIPRRDIPRRDIPRKDIPRRDIPRRDIPRRDIPRRDIPRRHIPRRDIPRKDIPEEIFPEEIFPEKIFPEKIFPEEIFPEEIFPEEIFPEEIFPREDYIRDREIFIIRSLSLFKHYSPEIILIQAQNSLEHYNDVVIADIKTQEVRRRRTLFSASVVDNRKRHPRPSTIQWWGGVGRKRWRDGERQERNEKIEEEGRRERERVNSSTHQSGRNFSYQQQEQGRLMGELFSPKMTVPEANRTPPLIQLEYEEQLTTVASYVKIAVGSDDISPYVLRHCANELAVPLSTVFNTCLVENTWPAMWNRPEWYLSIKKRYHIIIFEKLFVEEVCRHFDHHNLLSNRQFGFRSIQSTSDLLLLIPRDWQDALDNGLDTLVIAFDIAGGAFDRVWHRGLLEKPRAKGIERNLLLLLTDYLRGRTLRVVVNGQTSRDFPIDASVPQGSVLGLILWNIYIDDLLQHMPVVSAYADDCTLTCSYPRQDGQRAVQIVNQQLELIRGWNTRWQ
ncbi:RNA-directed DNA polymerase from mobile element jockey-like 32, partial [Homarus americanus]